MRRSQRERSCLALKFNDAVFVDETGKEVKGTLVFRTPDAAPAVGPADVEWVFRPDNGTTYMEMSGMVSVMVKAKPTSGGGAAAPAPHQQPVMW